jgi:putative redox protein
MVLAHCFTCSKSLKIIAHLAGALEQRGYAVLRFDFTGLGESEGEFSQTTVGTNVGDIISASHHMMSLELGPCALVGHSLGGAATLLAARSLPTVRSLAVVAAPCTPSHVRGLFAPQDVDAALARGRVDVELAGRRFPITREFLEDLERYPATERLGALKRPLLVVHGTADTIVEPAEGERIFAAASQPKAFEPVIGADHFLSGTGQTDEAAGLLAGFFDRTLGID